MMDKNFGVTCIQSQGDTRVSTSKEPGPRDANLAAMSGDPTPVPGGSGLTYRPNSGRKQHG